MAKIPNPPERYSTDWLTALDGRTQVAQVLKQRQQELSDDLGGLTQLSYQQRALVDRALFLEFHLQQEEMKLATGQEFDSGRWVQATNALLGVFRTLGLQRQAKTLPALRAYVQEANQ